MKRSSPPLINAARAFGFTALLASCAFLAPFGAAQVLDDPNYSERKAQPDNAQPETDPSIPALPNLPINTPMPEAIEPIAPQEGLGDDAFGDEPPAREGEASQSGVGGTADPVAEARPDLNISTDAERTAKLDALFETLKATQGEEDANLVAEEIWAIWLRSGSASVDYLLLRGNAAQKAGNFALAGRMYDHVVRLSPDYAEGWVRSARLAVEQGDLGRALHDSAQALIFEPRHFYALWTMGNVFERLGQQDEAFEAYSEALALYPQLKAVKDRVEYLTDTVEGQAL